MNEAASGTGMEIVNERATASMQPRRVRSSRGRRAARWLVGAGLVAGCVSLVGPVGTTHAEGAPTPGFIPASADWLTTVNYYRSMSGQPPVSEDAGMSNAARLHSCYMLANGISHDEVPGKPGYTAAGDASGNNSNVAVSSAINASARSFVELWMTGPYHAIGVLRPGLRTTGFGRCDDPATPTWHAGATLDVLHGLVAGPSLTQPIVFPGNGTTTSLYRFVAESPNPLDACRWTGAAGLPLLALLPESTAGASSTITGPNGPIQTCTVTEANTVDTAKQILHNDNAVSVIPRDELVDGTYHVTIHTDARKLCWSFTVDQGAANGTGGGQTAAAPAPPSCGTSGSETTTSNTAVNATPGGSLSRMQPLTPSRIVDTRVGRGAKPLQGGGMQRIQVSGTAGVPQGATAVVANITATEATSDGFVTLWDCAGARPTASTLNFQANQNVPNSATIPLDAQGGICVYAYASTQLLVDVTGYDSPNAPGHYNPLSPSRIMDTRTPLGPSSRLAAGQTVELKVTNTAGVPANASAVVLNVAADNASALGVVTVYPCGARPEASNLNPAPGETHANLVTTAVSASGTVCIYSLQPTELIVDVSGYFAASGAQLTVSTPFRFTDTRDGNPALSAGGKLRAGRVVEIPMAGVRGIAAGAKAISANITATDATGAGWIAAWPCSGGTPTVSNINYAASTPVANAAQLTLSGQGSICVISYTDADVIIDVNGWWA